MELKELSGLSGPELEMIARELLAELSGADLSRAGTFPAGEGGVSAAAAMSELSAGIRELRAAALAAQGGEAKAVMAETLAEAGGARRDYARAGDNTPGLYGSASRFGLEAAAPMPDLEALSEAFRRDSRRYDAGYERY